MPPNRLLLLVVVVTAGCSQIPGSGPPLRNPVPDALPPPTIQIPGINGTIPSAPPINSQTGGSDHPQMSIATEVKRKSGFPERIGDVLSPKEIKEKKLSPNTKFESWSVFLMPNYTEPFKKPELVTQLKDAFVNLGSAIGPTNLSVWFVTGKVALPDHPEKVYDYHRAQEMIEHLRLGSATGPYIVISVKPPNEMMPGDEVFVARLMGIDSQCYPGIIDDLGQHIKEHGYTSKIRNSWQQMNIEITRNTCSVTLTKLLKGKD
jgi:hypothetical protein